MTLREYAEKVCRVTNTPMGDFVADVRLDSRMPAIESLPDLVSYLRWERHAREDVLRLAARFWRRYRKWHDKNNEG